MDKISSAARSAAMRKIKSKKTGLEKALVKALRAIGLRGYRLNAKIHGKPDVAFIKAKMAIFADGCFWHGCPKCHRAPENNKAYCGRRKSGAIKSAIGKLGRNCVQRDGKWRGSGSMRSKRDGLPRSPKTLRATSVNDCGKKAFET